MGAVDDGGSPHGLLVTDDEVIRTWAEETVGDFLARTEPLAPETIDTQG